MTSIVRIPATITATATSHKTEGKVVIVAVEELDGLEAEIERLRGVLEAVEVMLRPGIGQATADVLHKVVLNWLGQEGVRSDGDAD